MSAPNSAPRQDSPFFSRPVLVIAAIFFFPTLLPSLFGWLLGVLAVPVAYTLTVNEKTQGIRILRNSLLLAGSASLLTGRLDLFLFVLTLFPLGYCFYACGCKHKTEAITGGYGVLTLGASWIFFWTLYGISSGIHPYQHLLEMLDAGFVQTYELYKTNSDIPVELQENLAVIILEIRALIPRILPGILCCTILVTVWMNQITLNILLLRHHKDKRIWPPYSAWKLPDELIWILITATILFLLGKGGLKDIGLNMLLISVVLYFFQGLAVFMSLLTKWNVPGYIRVLLYFMLVIQSYGLILMALLGIGDIWLKLRPNPDSPEQEK